MNVTLVMVSSLNGKITSGDDSDIYHWTSAEDAKHFSSIITKHNLIVMGSKTYEAAKRKIMLTDKILRIVMTGDPEKYSRDSVPGQLEFTNETPESLVQKMEIMGFTELLLVGGGKINASFLQAKLVHVVLLTIEPVLFGSGNNLIADADITADLKLIKMQKLNGRGTLLLTYHVLP